MLELASLGSVLCILFVFSLHYAGGYEKDDPSSLTLYTVVVFCALAFIICWAIFLILLQVAIVFQE